MFICLLQSYLRFDTDGKKWACIECGNKYRQKVYAREHVVHKHIGPEKAGDDQVNKKTYLRFFH
jgi:hypothetical protein